MDSLPRFRRHLPGDWLHRGGEKLVGLVERPAGTGSASTRRQRVENRLQHALVDEVAEVLGRLVLQMMGLINDQAVELRQHLVCGVRQQQRVI